MNIESPNSYTSSIRIKTFGRSGKSLLLGIPNQTRRVGAFAQGKEEPLSGTKDRLGFQCLIYSFHPPPYMGFSDLFYSLPNREEFNYNNALKT